jgi:hypothetical protein
MQDPVLMMNDAMQREGASGCRKGYENCERH